MNIFTKKIKTALTRAVSCMLGTAIVAGSMMGSGGVASAAEATYISGAMRSSSGDWFGKDGAEVVVDTVGGEKKYDSGMIYGRYTDTAGASIEGGKVIINGGTIVDYSIYGGKSLNGNANGNTVIVNGGTMGNIYAGYGGTYEKSKGNANNNTVIITGGNITKDVYGGLSYGGTANGNEITITGGMIRSVYGGAVYEGNGNAENNKVNLVGIGGKMGDINHTADIEIGDILRVGSASYSSEGISSNNTLNVYGKDIKVGGIVSAAVQRMNFYIQDGLKYGDTMVNLTGSYISNYADTKINVIVEAKPQPNGADKTINLLKNTGTGSIKWVDSPIKGEALDEGNYAIVKKDGATLSYWDNSKNSVALSGDKKSLVLTLDGLGESGPRPEPEPGEPNLNMGTSAAMPLIDAIEKNKDSMSDGMKAFSYKLLDHADVSTTAGMANVRAGVSGAFQASEVTGATSTAVSVTSNVSNLTLSRMSLVDTANVGGGMGVGLMDPGSGAGAWFRYVHGKDNGDGMKMDGGTAEYTNTYNGFVIGADFKKVGKFQSGVAFSYVDGRGNNTFRDTFGAVARWGHTDFHTYNFGYYGSIKNDTTNTMFDISYGTTSADSDTYGVGGAQSFTSKSNIWNMGVTVEKSFNNADTGVKFVPYTGLRYMNVNNGEYTDSIGFKHQMKKQNIFMLPVGFKLSKTTTMSNGWSVTPKLDMSYTWNMGNTDSEMTISTPGLSASSTLGYSFMDKGSFTGVVGVEAQHKNCTYGVSFAYQKGSHQDSKKIMADIKLTF